MLYVKMDFTRKARWELYGHRNPSPKGSTCARIVSRESARIAFTHVSLNDVDVWSCDIQKVLSFLPSTSAASLRLASASILCLCLVFLILDVSLDIITYLFFITKGTRQFNSDSLSIFLALACSDTSIGFDFLKSSNNSQSVDTKSKKCVKHCKSTTRQWWWGENRVNIWSITMQNY